MNILITGAFGFLGSNIAKLFIARGHSVFGCGRTSLNKEHLSSIGFSKWIVGDITNGMLDEVRFLPDIVIHCAGGASVAKSIDNPYEDFQDTVVGAGILLEHIRVNYPHARVIYPSTAAVYGSYDNVPIPIEAPTNPKSPYGFNKLMAEGICKNYFVNYGIRSTIVRLFSVYGSGLRKQILWDASNRFSTNNSEPFWGSGNEVRDFVHIDDVSELFYTISTKSDLDGNLTLNCGSGVSHTVRQILEELALNFDQHRAVDFNMQIRNGDPLYLCADISKTLELGWRPIKNIDVGLSDYVNWFKKSNPSSVIKIK